MKIGIITDLHIGHYPEKIKEFKTFIGSLRCDLLIIAGDIASSKQSEIELAFKIIRDTAPFLEVLVVFGNHDCVDSDTELLTKRGWLNYKEILPSDEVFSLNDREEGVWSHINDIIYKKSNHILKLEHGRINMAITKNHRILHKKRFRKKGKTTFSDIQYNNIDSIKGRIRIPHSAKKINNEYPIKDDELRILAWIITDGYYRKNKKLGEFTIYQSKKDGIKKIKSTLKSLNYSYSHKVRQRDISHICNKKLKNKPLPQHSFTIDKTHNSFLEDHLGEQKKILQPEMFNQLSQRQLLIFINTLIDGDGTFYKDKTRKGNAMLYGKLSFLNWVQTLTVQAGIRTSLYCYRKEEGHYRLNLSFNKSYSDFDPSQLKINKVNYNSDVWCLNVPYSNFMVRRNGISYFTGNCWVADEPFITLSEVLEKRKELCKKYKIHYLENKKYENEKVTIYGFDGWYRFSNTGTNDKDMMPNNSGMGELTPFQLMQRNEGKAIDYILDDLDKNKNSNKKKFIITHFNLSCDERWEKMSGNPRYMELLTPEVDYLIYGHSHQPFRKTINNCTVINAGADYEQCPRLDLFYEEIIID